MFQYIRVFILFSFLTSCISTSKVQNDSSSENVSGGASSADPYIWLEDSKDPKVMKWVEQHNARSTAVLEKNERYKKISDEVREIVTAKDRIPYPKLVVGPNAGMVRNFWQDQEHQRGIWRQTSLTDYQAPSPQWDTILDIDDLNRKEAKSWVYKGMECLPPEEDLCLLFLSDGGRDEVVVREFQVSTKSFVQNGFEVPSAKTHINWIDRDRVFIGSNFGPDSITSSGYPRDVRIWERGTPLSSAKIVFVGDKTDVSSTGWRVFQTASNTMYIEQSVNFFEAKVFSVEGESITQLPFPTTASFQGEFAGQILAKLRDDWKTPHKLFTAGAVVSIPLAQAGKANAAAKAELVYQPDAVSTLSHLSHAKDFLILNVLKNIRGEFLMIKRRHGKWVTQNLAFPNVGPNVGPNQGATAIIDTSEFDNHIFASYQSFNEPTGLYYSDGQVEKGFEKVKSLPAKFDATDIVAEQFKATSKDGTKVPYFIVHKKNMQFDANNPTLLYGYGGFEHSLTPFYSGVTGKLWLSSGGVYVLANIRGGGEFGPRWHEAALKEKRQRAYDDFASVAKDLFNRKITSPAKLGIQGGSNGGLLVGVSFTQHPEYYRAVVCESALLDMIRYTLLPPGASWIGEYGDPADPKVAQYISEYSPYQNLKKDAHYPEAFFHISTADDRVQPGHTRKTVARMEALGHPVLFFENTEGGHGGAADLEQTVKKVSLEYVYLYQKLMTPDTSAKTR